MIRRLAVTVLLLASAALAADPALINLLMPDARMVAGIDFDRARNTAFGRFVISQVDQQADEDLRKLIAMTGFDPRRDIGEALVATVEMPGPKKSNALVVARGNFDVARLTNLAKTEGGAVVASYAGVDIYMGKDSGDNAFAFLGQSVAVAGDLELVKGAIDRRSGGKGPEAAVAARIRDLSARNELWALTTLPVSSFAHNVPDRTASGALKGDALKSIEEAAGGIRLGEANIEITGEAITTTEKDAASLADVIRFIANMIQLNRNNPETAELAAIVDTMQVKAEARKVTVSLSVPEEKIEKMILQKKTTKKAPSKRV